MTIQSCGMKIQGYSASSDEIDTTDSEIKSLMRQREQIQKRINEIKSSKQSDEIKNQLLKPLNQQLAEIDSEIQQKQIEKAREKSEPNSDAGKATSNNEGIVKTGDATVSTAILKKLGAYNKLGRLAAESAKAKSSAAEKQAEAASTDAQEHPTLSKRLNEEASALKSCANSEIKAAAKEASKILKGDEKSAKKSSSANDTGCDKSKNDADGNDISSDSN